MEELIKELNDRVKRLEERLDKIEKKENLELVILDMDVDGFNKQLEHVSRVLLSNWKDMNKDRILAFEEHGVKIESKEES